MVVSAGMPVLCGAQVLTLDASCTEAIACLAAEHFYGDQPELAIRYYRRLLQVTARHVTSGKRPVASSPACSVSHNSKDSIH